MTRGESSREKVTRKILKLAADEENHRTSYFTKNIDAAKNTVIKYLKELVYSEKLMDVRLAEDSFRHMFRINERGLKVYERMKLKDELSRNLEEMPVEKIIEMLVRSQKIIEILRLQEESEREYKHKVALANATLEGEELERRLEEIWQEELNRMQFIIQNDIEKGIKGAKEREKRLNEGIATLERWKTELASVPPDESFEILMKHRRELYRQIVENGLG